MSDYIVYKTIDCPNYCEEGTEYTETEARRCSHCVGGKARIEVDLEEAVIEVLVKSLKQNSRLSRLIRQTSVLPKLR